MSGTTRVTPSDMSRWAVAHEDAASACAVARTDNAHRVADSQTWGPMAYEVRRATVDAANSREELLVAHEKWEHDTATKLRAGGGAFEQMNDQNRANSGAIADPAAPTPQPSPPPSGGGMWDIPDADKLNPR